MSVSAILTAITSIQYVHNDFKQANGDQAVRTR